jgi:hypothetical protein
MFPGHLSCSLSTLGILPSQEDDQLGFEMSSSGEIGACFWLQCYEFPTLMDWMDVIDWVYIFIFVLFHTTATAIPILKASV